MAFNIYNRRYTGSKTKIVDWIISLMNDNCVDSISFCDLFAGTGVVTNAVINKYNKFYINDFLYSNEIIYNAFFGKKNYSEEKINKFYKKYNDLKSDTLNDNYVSLNYGNKFFNYDDSKVIGFIREDIENHKNILNNREYCILIASLVYSFDRCANTVGHYDAYFKNATLKSMFKFELINPVILDSNDSREVYISRLDSNVLAPKIRCDIVYIDPPYSSRQYSRFYHVIENIVKWEKPELYGTALKPLPENMSEYCSKNAIDAFRSLIADLKCKYIVVSYNNTYNSKSQSSKNKMTLEDIETVLRKKGKTQMFSIDHQAFNAGKTDLKDHQEILFITEVGANND